MRGEINQTVLNNTFKPVEMLQCNLFKHPEHLVPQIGVYNNRTLKCYLKKSNKTTFLEQNCLL